PRHRPGGRPRALAPHRRPPTQNRPARHRRRRAGTPRPLAPRRPRATTLLHPLPRRRHRLPHRRTGQHPALGRPSRARLALSPAVLTAPLLATLLGGARAGPAALALPRPPARPGRTPRRIFGTIKYPG